MPGRRYTFPRVNELATARRDERPPPPDRRPTQRDLVAASLLLRPARHSPARHTSR